MTDECKKNMKLQTNQQIYDQIYINISLLRHKAEEIRSVSQVYEDNSRQENILLNFEISILKIAKNLEEYSLESLRVGNRRELQTTLSLSTIIISSPTLQNKIGSIKKEEEIIDKSIAFGYR